MIEDDWRDILIASDLSAAGLGAVLAAGFDLPSGSLILHSDDWDNVGEAGHIEVKPLELPEDFNFIVSIRLAGAIDTDRLPRLARLHRLTIAWAVDESVEQNWNYHVAFPDGRVTVHWIHPQEPFRLSPAQP